MFPIIENSNEIAAPTVAIENTISIATATSLKSLNPIRETQTQANKTITAIIP